MRPKVQERGQALVIIALAVVGLFGFSALAIDGSRVFSDRRNAQNAADTAALSAALAKIRGTGTEYVTAAMDRAESNGYSNDKVEVNLCNDPLITTACVGIPAGESPANYIQVKITSIIPATFARVIGRQEFKNVVTSIAYSGPVEPQPLINGAALAALAEHEKDAIFGTGNFSLDVNNSGIFSNSDVQDVKDPCQNGSMSVGGNSTYEVDTAVQVVGTLCQGKNTEITGPIQQTGQIPYPPDIDIPLPSITCSGTGSKSDSVVDGVFRTTYYPGTYSSQVQLTSTGEVIFSPGKYCFQDGVKITGPDVIANDVDFKITGGDFDVSGNGTFTCNDVLVHIDGGTGMKFNGTGGNFCNSITFIASTGTVEWNGTVDNRLFAPIGGVYDGLLIYLPESNKSEVKINGNSDNQLTGSIIAVGSKITVEGNEWTTGFNSQIIGYTIALKGNGNVVINYVPEDQYWEIDPSAIQLTK